MINTNTQIYGKLTSFLYELMRDYITPGKVEHIMANSEDPDVTYCNGYLAEYAEIVANRLLTPTILPSEQVIAQVLAAKEKAASENLPLKFIVMSPEQWKAINDTAIDTTEYTRAHPIMSLFGYDVLLSPFATGITFLPEAHFMEWKEPSLTAQKVMQGIIDTSNQNDIEIKYVLMGPNQWEQLKNDPTPQTMAGSPPKEGAPLSICGRKVIILPYLNTVLYLPELEEKPKSDAKYTVTISDNTKGADYKWEVPGELNFEMHRDIQYGWNGTIHPGIANVTITFKT